MSDRPIQSYGGKVETGGVETPIKDWCWTVERPVFEYPLNPRARRNLAILFWRAANYAHQFKHGKPATPNVIEWGSVKLEGRVIGKFEWKSVPDTYLARVPVEEISHVSNDNAEFDRLWKEAGGS